VLLGRAIKIANMAAMAKALTATMAAINSVVVGETTTSTNGLMPPMFDLLSDSEPYSD